MKKVILTTFTIILLLLTLLVGWTFFTRMAMPYNEEGRFFDEESMTVYKQQSVLSYGLFTAIGLVLTTLTFIIRKNVYKKNQ